jgi:hypothetical protein
VPAGSTQEEVSSIVEASIKDSKISGGDRPVAWDGATMGGQDLQNQVGFAASLVQSLTSPEDPPRDWTFSENPGMESRGAPGNLTVWQPKN